MEGENREERQMIKIEGIALEKMSLQQRQRAEQLYHQLGLEPVIDKVLKEFSNSLSGLDRVADKVLGPYDIKGRADAVAKVTTLITYMALSEQFNKEAGNLESQITSLAGERDQVRTNYDNLVGKVAEIVGGDYDELKANYNQLVDRLAEIEHLRSQVATLNKERAQLTDRYESQIATQKNEHDAEVENFRAKIAERDSKIKGLESEKTTLSSELEQLRGDYNQAKTAITTVAGAIPCEEIGKKLAKELYTVLLEDSKVPGMVIDGVGKFIDFKKYLGIAVERGAEEARKCVEEVLGETLRTIQ